MSGWYDRKGNLISIEEFETFAATRDYKQVAAERVDDVLISTVWLGLDHSFGDGPPLIFETMIFGGTLNDYCERYATEEEAEEGHQRAVEQVKDEREAFKQLAADPLLLAALRVVRDATNSHLRIFGRDPKYYVTDLIEALLQALETRGRER